MQLNCEATKKFKKTNGDFEVVLKPSDIPLEERKRLVQKWLGRLLFNENINEDIETQKYDK